MAIIRMCSIRIWERRWITFKAPKQDIHIYVYECLKWTLVWISMANGKIIWLTTSSVGRSHYWIGLCFGCIWMVVLMLVLYLLHGERCSPLMNSAAVTLSSPSRQTLNLFKSDFLYSQSHTSWDTHRMCSGMEKHRYWKKLKQLPWLHKNSLSSFFFPWIACYY